MGERYGVMHVGQDVIEKWIPPGKSIDLVAEKIGTVDYEWFHRALKLPANSRVDGVSYGFRFLQREISIRIECPDFVETEFPNTIPEVEEFYNEKGFVGWGGPGAATNRYAGSFHGYPVVITDRLPGLGQPEESKRCKTYDCGGEAVQDGLCGPCWAKGQL